MTDDPPPRVRAAEERQDFRELLERSSLGTPGAVALRKIGAWHLRTPGAERPTVEDYRLADKEIGQMGGDKPASWGMDDCGIPGCTGYSCTYCGRCTAECPNMKCART